jgi:hypothetical protein
MTIHKSKDSISSDVPWEDYSRKPKDKLWLESAGMDFGLPKGFNR